MADRAAIVAQLPYTSRVAFTAFCAERCVREARRYLRTREQLELRPSICESLELLWALVGGATAAEAVRVRWLADDLRELEVANAAGDGTVLHADAVLVKAVIPLLKGLALAVQPESGDTILPFKLDGSVAPRQIATPRYVAGAMEGPVMAVGHVYADAMSARDAEKAVCDQALLRLRDVGADELTCMVRPHSRLVTGGDGRRVSGGRYGCQQHLKCTTSSPRSGKASLARRVTSELQLSRPSRPIGS